MRENAGASSRAFRRGVLVWIQSQDTLGLSAVADRGRKRSSIMAPAAPDLHAAIPAGLPAKSARHSGINCPPQGLRTGIEHMPFGGAKHKVKARSRAAEIRVAANLHCRKPCLHGS